MNSYPNVLTPPSDTEAVAPTPIFISSTFFPTFATQHVPRKDDGPYLKIIEQPVDRFRFRYKSEMTGTHGSLNGWSSDRTRKQTFPTVELINFDKPAIIRCSIYQYNPKTDNMPHAHRLVKRHGNKEERDDPHDVPVSQELGGYQVVFHSMGIIHTAKKNIIPELARKKRLLKKEEIARLEGKRRELNTKEEMEIKKAAENESKNINLNTVCLRFDAFIKTEKGILHPICRPVYTHGINNLKSALTGELKIVRMDHVNSPAKGGKEVFLLVERVTKKNIKVKFYELDDDENILWEDYGKFSDLDVHHQYAIVFKTPPYKDVNITQPVKVYIELERPSDKATSDPKEFTYIPNQNMYEPASKRPRNSESCENFEPINNTIPTSVEELMACNNSGLSQIGSADFAEALKDIASEEFSILFDSYKESYGSLTQDAALQKMMLKQAHSNQFYKKFCGGTVSQESDLRRTAIQKTVTIQEETLAKRLNDEFRNFMKTRPNDDRIKKMIASYLGEKDQSNVLHIGIRMGDESITMLILNLICKVKQYEIVNIKNSDGYSPLHLAIIITNEKFINNLIYCKAKVSDVDPFFNNCLHLAVSYNVSIEAFKKLLSVENVKSFIDDENTDGDTALNLAIETKRYSLFYALCEKGANVNKAHKKNGYTPLRFAIEKQETKMVKYLLNHPHVNPFLEDFNKINPLQVAKKEGTPEIIELVDEYLKKHNCTNVDLRIKPETEGDSIEDETLEHITIKDEPISNDELMEMYANVEHFTPDCLDKISQMLDESGGWKSLSEVLELGYAFRSNLWESSGSPSKCILKLAVESNGDKVWKIRNLLKDLNELEVVETIDKMVKKANL